ncbi:hypothetical protein L915_11939 [Phytophthora nicotianae]|uniref:Uncharacterized protein n=1 Tax=Phytophthora nicotianae TaxID=4792 RepID=W2GI44_PHYNI|nr:hypothetical protein L915_11939 [Phytophthora nicotianae]
MKKKKHQKLEARNVPKHPVERVVLCLVRVGHHASYLEITSSHVVENRKKNSFKHELIFLQYNKHRH